MFKNKILSAIFIALFVSGTSLFATNGMLMSSYGARQAGMGGAFLAVGGSIMDLEGNPAHLARNKDSIMEIGSAVMVPYMTYRDTYYTENPETSYNNAVTSEPGATPLPYMGFTTKLGRNVGAGIAFYAQGGMAAEFNGIIRNTPGNVTLNEVIQGMTGDPSASMPYIGHLRQMRENTYTNFGFARLTPGLAVRFGDLSIGAGLDLGAAKMAWRWTFSDPSGIMELPGAGYRYKSDPAFSLSGKVGLVYELTDNFRIAYTYKARTKMHLDGDMSVNAGDPNFFKKLDTSMYLEWPESHHGGLAYSRNGFTVSLDVRYIMWSNVMNTVEFNMPYAWAQTPIGNNINTLPFNLKWEDQTIVAVGMEYMPGNTAYRIGYNYGKSPVTGQGINPLFPAITEHHASAGLGWKFDSVQIDFALEYAFPGKVKGSDMSDWDMFHALSGLTIDQVQNPYFNHSVTMYQIIPHIGATYKF